MTATARCYLVPLIVAITALSCSSPSGPQADFGSHYRVLLEPNPPVLDSTTLSVTVAYGGCGSDPRFVLRHRIRPGSFEVWLRKTSREEPCDMLTIERLVFAVPASVRSSAAVTLAMPDDEQYQLRP